MEAMNTSARTVKTTRKESLSREGWLEAALEVLSQKGGAKLRIDSLVRQVGVTKGSFYWHFKNREDFIHSLIDYWHENYTLNVSSYLDEVEGTPGEKLLLLMEMVFLNQLTRYDLAIRSWALAEPELQARLKRTDNHRIGYLKQLFQGMGFPGDAAEFRAHVFLGEASWEAALFKEMTDEQRRKHAHDLYALLVSGIDGE
jgi:AcrR family transcriptional regulator